MTQAAGGFTVRPTGSVTVAITRANGNTPVVYTTKDCTTAITMPDATSTSKTYYVVGDDSYVLSAKPGNASENANGIGGTVTQRIRDGQLRVVDVAPLILPALTAEITVVQAALDAKLGAGTAAEATTLGTVVKKVQVYDAAGASLGYIAIYDALT